MDQAAWIGNAINSDVSSGAITGSSPSFGRYCVAVAEAAAFSAANVYFFCLTAFSAPNTRFFHLMYFFRIVAGFFSPQVFFMFPKKCVCLSNLTDGLRTDHDNLILRNLHSKFCL